MYPSISVNQRLSVWLLVAFMVVVKVQSQTIHSSSVSCPGSQLLCGDRICYDPTRQACTDLGTIVECIDVCGSKCYNTNTQKCFNGTVCSNSEELCIVERDSSFGYDYNPPISRCYNPARSACFHNELCDHPYRSCNGKCLRDNQVCVNNVTACNITDHYYNYEQGRIQLCNGVCYDSASQKCAHGSVRCIDECGNVCFNSSSHQCFNGTVCSNSEELCIVERDSSFGYDYNPPISRCYNPARSACFHNELCDHPYRSCNGKCLRDNQVCVNNVTACNITDRYYNYEQGRIQLCNGVCYDSASQKCAHGSVRCIDECGNVCFNSSSHQCFNGTVCSNSEELCIVERDSSFGYDYNPPISRCYNPARSACFHSELCDHPYRSCNGKCLRDNQVCVNDVTACNITDRYYNYEQGRIQLCNGVCYDSAVEKCVDVHGLTNFTLNTSTTTTTTIRTTITTTATTTTFRTTITTTTPITTTVPSNSSSCCSVNECETDADCCMPTNGCRCFKTNTLDYGVCLNPYVRPISATGCPGQGECKNDTDCCKCQCGQVTVTNVDGSRVTKSQCVPR